MVLLFVILIIIALIFLYFIIIIIIDSTYYSSIYTQYYVSNEADEAGGRSFIISSSVFSEVDGKPKMIPKEVSEAERGQCAQRSLSRILGKWAPVLLLISIK